ncbi:HS12A-like protein [Mya arenaria]|uniref:HS12A-like protein n=1 Tax=Mya arenaria TaxID=6604 RepID=A0ABY7EZI7_MYAAR|nr:HS12A-like protein [Mya arenaria]
MYPVRTEARDHRHESGALYLAERGHTNGSPDIEWKVKGSLHTLNTPNEGGPTIAKRGKKQRKDCRILDRAVEENLVEFLHKNELLRKSPKTDYRNKAKGQRILEAKATELQISVDHLFTWFKSRRDMFTRQAGVDPNRLKLALEPECASIWCETLDMDVKGAVAIQGSQYMVVDLGGGTADISVHERKPDGTLKEIYKASGGPWGGIYVDENYMKMLNKLFGEKALTDLRKTEMNDYFDVTREFEHKKRSFDTDITKQILVRISASLRDLAEMNCSKSLEERISSLKVRENAITTRGKDKLKIDTTVVQSWFKRPIDRLIQHLKSLLAEPKIKSVQTVILVGGFGESPYVQERMRNEIPDVRLIVPADAGLVVLKGAVRFGHNPAIVSSRVMKYTYGTRVYDTFDEQKHPEEKKVWINGKWWLDKCFKVYVRVNEEVRVDQQVTRKNIPASEITHTPVYRTTQENPEYVTDSGCELLGTVELENSTDIPYEQQRLILETRRCDQIGR